MVATQPILVLGHHPSSRIWAEVMYDITLKYQGWFYASRMQRPDLFTALGAVLDSHEHTAVQWYQVRPLAVEEGAPVPREKAEATDPLVRVVSFHK